MAAPVAWAAFQVANDDAAVEVCTSDSSLQKEDTAENGDGRDSAEEQACILDDHGDNSCTNAEALRGKRHEQLDRKTHLPEPESEPLRGPEKQEDQRRKTYLIFPPPPCRSTYIIIGPLLWMRASAILHR